MKPKFLSPIAFFFLISSSYPATLSFLDPEVVIDNVNCTSGTCYAAGFQYVNSTYQPVSGVLPAGGLSVMSLPSGASAASVQSRSAAGAAGYAITGGAGYWAYWTPEGAASTLGRGYAEAIDADGFMAGMTRVGNSWVVAVATLEDGIFTPAGQLMPGTAVGVATVDGERRIAANTYDYGPTALVGPDYHRINLNVGPGGYSGLGGVNSSFYWGFSAGQLTTWDVRTYARTTYTRYGTGAPAEACYPVSATASGVIICSEVPELYVPAIGAVIDINTYYRDILGRPLPHDILSLTAVYEDGNDLVFFFQGSSGELRENRSVFLDPASAVPEPAPAGLVLVGVLIGLARHAQRTGGLGGWLHHTTSTRRRL